MSSKSTVGALLESLRGPPQSAQNRTQTASRVARALVEQVRALEDAAERRQNQMLARMMRDPRGQAATTAIADRLYRSRDASRTAEQLSAIVERFGIPRYMTPLERAGLAGVRPLASLLPETLARAVARRVRSDSRRVLLDADPATLSRHLSVRHTSGLTVNVNQLGEAVLGEAEAERRVAGYVELAGRAGVDSLSIKLSSIASQLDVLARERSLESVVPRLASIFRAAAGDDAQPTRRTVMLDMEAYRDAELTLEAFERALALPGLSSVHAGVVLQAYLPDAHGWYERLLRFAQRRTAQGGAALRVRLVKGANLLAERVETSVSGHTLPMYAGKLDVDASFKRLVERATDVQNARHLHVGIASHNLFDVAFGLCLVTEREVGSFVCFELLEGMADALARVLAAERAAVLLYAPVVDEGAMSSAIAYLVRRLDEATADENFLRSSFSMHAGDAAFEHEQRKFADSAARMHVVDTTPRRAGEASFERERSGAQQPRHGSFCNEPDSDFSSASNRAWIERVLVQVHDLKAPDLCSVVGGAPYRTPHVLEGFDPSRPGHVPYRFCVCDERGLERALACAAADATGFSHSEPSARAHLLAAVAHALRDARGSLIAWLVCDGGKRVLEADVEVSEAIDFAEYYGANLLELARDASFDLRARGTVLVAPPWNFPLAIAAGGIFAALAAGNRVIFKPSLETIAIAYELASLCWQAGVPREVLQLVVCEDSLASGLVRDARVDAVVLTGATDTAKLLYSLRPGLQLMAETGGKNALIVSAMSDRDLAIRDAVRSAFGHAGQKCSAASLLVCEAEVYDDAAFADTLRDAAASLRVGSAWDLGSFVTPLMRPPSGPLLHAMQTLEAGERWLLEPHVDARNPNLVSPGLKLGVRRGSFTHATELFGPVLGVMRARDLADAFELVRATGYGLTSGLSSLDEREQERFVQSVPAGNLYVNRAITGAVVRRQPFGGFGKSGFGPGAKAGGPNYVLQLGRAIAREVAPSQPALPNPWATHARSFDRWLDPRERRVLASRTGNYLRAHDEWYGTARDVSQVLGQDNLLRYLPCPGIVVRVQASSPLLDVLSVLIAAGICGCEVTLSLAPDVSHAAPLSSLGQRVFVDDDAHLERRLIDACRVRVLGPASAALLDAASRAAVHVASEPVLSVGRVELLHYLREQSLSIDYHRYGNLGLRGI